MPHQRICGGRFGPGPLHALIISAFGLLEGHCPSRADGASRALFVDPVEFLRRPAVVAAGGRLEHARVDGEAFALAVRWLDPAVLVWVAR